MFNLGTEKGRQQVRRQIARPALDAGVLVDFPAEKPAPVRSLFPKDFGALIKPRIVNQERTPFTASEILCLMETESRKLPKCAEVSPHDTSHTDHARYLRLQKCHA